MFSCSNRIGLCRSSFSCRICKRKNVIYPGSYYQEKLRFDTDLDRIEELKKGFDRTGEISQEVLSKINFSNLTNKISDIVTSDVFLVTVPTPIDDFKKPDLTALKILHHYWQALKSDFKMP